MKTLLFLTLSGSAMALLLMIIGKLSKKKLPSVICYYAWLLVLMRFILPLNGIIPTGREAPEQTQIYDTATSYGDALDATSASTVEKAVTNTGLQAEHPVTTGNTAAEMEFSSVLPEAEHISFWKQLQTFMRSETFWACVWATGAFISFSVCVMSYISFTGKIARNLSEPDLFTLSVYISIPGSKPALYLCDSVSTPMMYGLFSPKIVLPDRRFSDEELKNILSHELVHFRRKDTLYKWFSVLVLSLHWFNPLTYFIRKEINRSCELSCDEMLLRSMGREEKASYGNTLLRMAASSALPSGVVATTFSTEKENLKERLEQIMNFKKSKIRILTAVLVMALLAGCGAAAGPAKDKSEPEDDPNATIVKVSTVDEFLEAIGPDRIIELAEGTYDLSTAKDYGSYSEKRYYSWNNVYDEGGELEIHGADNLTIRGAGTGKTVIAAIPRYANVLLFSDCRDVHISKLTAGHTTEPGFCAGGVLKFDLCRDVSVDKCGLYGCGTIGVSASNCSDITVTATDIYECSNGAVESYSSRNVRVADCNIYSCGTKAGDSSAFCLFYAAASDGFAVYDSRIYNNRTQMLFNSYSSKNAMFLSNTVKNNEISSNAFSSSIYSATVDGCSFTDNNVGASWSGSAMWGGADNVPIKDAEGRDIPEEAFELMKYRKIDPDSIWSSVPVTAAADVPAGGQIKVSSVDEFIAAIGPNRTILLEPGIYDLSTAEGYGVSQGENYYWESRYDGPQLVISDLSGLAIRAESDDPSATTIAATPRYANVLSFKSCYNIELNGFTAGHTKEQGECAGGVLYFEGSGDIKVGSCRLYGCGTLGIDCYTCNSIDVRECEIYECSYGAVSMVDTDGIGFTDCDIHDVPSPAVTFYNCGDKYWNGKPVSGLDATFDVGPDGELKSFSYGYDGFNISMPNDPFSDNERFPFEQGSPLLIFAKDVQTDIAEGNWESLADKIVFPISIISNNATVTINSREDFLSLAENDVFGILSSDFREFTAEAPLNDYGWCVYGNTIANDRIAVLCVGNSLSYENLRITCISTDESLIALQAG